MDRVQGSGFGVQRRASGSFALALCFLPFLNPESRTLNPVADQLLASIEIPKLGELLLDNAGRTHDRIAKTAMRETLLTHATTRILLHFARPAHDRYGYAERSPHYRHFKQKRFHTSIDLILSGRTKHAMTTQRQITVGGSATGGDLKGDLKLRFPWNLTGNGGQTTVQAAHARRRAGLSKGAPLSARARRDGKPRVTIAQMRKEIATITPDERSQMVAELRDRYVTGVKTTAGPRQRVKI
jgi:hypothetical protein